MSRYRADGKNSSAMVHATRGHDCSFCEERVFGNGGKVSHARKHVRAGEAIELVKHYGHYPPISSRLFIAAGDDETLAKWLGQGFEQVTS